MPARTISTATISFGLVSVPVQVFATGESAASVSFNMLHKKCGTRLKQQYICPKDEVVVERDDMAKGYEFAKNQYVVFSPEEIKALDQKATNTIDIDQFVPLSAVDRIYLEKAYYLGPDKGGHRAYKLLAKALEETGRAALGQYASRGRQYLVLVRPRDGVLVMEQLHYADELRPTSEVPLGEEGEVKPAELTLAKTADRAGRDRGIQAGKLPRHGARTGPGGDQQEGRGPGDHHRARGEAGDQGDRPDGGAQGERGQGQAQRPPKNPRRPRRRRPPAGSRPVRQSAGPPVRLRWHFRLVVQGVEGQLLPQGAARRRSTRLLRRQVPHRRDQQHLLPDAAGARAARLDLGKVPGASGSRSRPRSGSPIMAGSSPKWRTRFPISPG